MARFDIRQFAWWWSLGALLVLPSAARAGVHVSLGPDSAVVQPGDTLTVTLTVFQAESEFNGFDAYVSFDSTRFRLVSTPMTGQIGSLVLGACGNLFTSFVAHPDKAEIHLGFLCPATFVTGPGEIFKFRLRVLAGLGPANLSWSTGTEFFRAGFFVRPLDAVPMTLSVQNLAEVGPPPAHAASVSLETPRPNPYRGSGPATLQFSLASGARVGFAILDAQGRRVASLDPEEFGAGTHFVTWTGLRLSPGRYLVKMDSGNGIPVARAWVVVR